MEEFKVTAEMLDEVLKESFDTLHTGADSESVREAVQRSKMTILVAMLGGLDLDSVIIGIHIGFLLADKRNELSRQTSPVPVN